MDDDRSPLAGTEVHYLPSAISGSEFKIFVGHCGDEGAAGVPVLYLTDANGYFGGAVDLVRSMQLRRFLPPMLVVGIGYRAGPIGDTIERRTLDLTPTADPAFARLHPGLEAMGGADRLLGFIRSELQPWVAARYAADPGDSTYFGHSLGGLFGTWVLLHAPDTFRRYILGSPSLWWDDHRVLDEARDHRLPGATPDRSVFIGVGGNETDEGRRRENARLPDEERAVGGAWRIDLVADAAELVDRLAGRDGSADPWFEVFPEEFHVTVPFLILSRGLRRVFGAPT